MLRDLIRSIGIACIISGITLYFIGTNTSQNTGHQSENTKLQEEIDTLQLALQSAKEELATLQMMTSADEELEHSNIDAVNSDQESSETQIIKTILRIESGMNSSAVSSELERTGILDRAIDLENFLQTNGLSGKIQIGEYELDSSMNFEQIGKIITSSK